MSTAARALHSPTVMSDAGSARRDRVLGSPPEGTIVACSRCGADLEGKEGLCAACWQAGRAARAAADAARMAQRPMTPVPVILGAALSGTLLMLWPFVLIADVMSFAAAHGELSYCVESPFGFFVCFSLGYPLLAAAGGAASGLLLRRHPRWSAAFAFLPGVLLLLSFTAVFATPQ